MLRKRNTYLDWGLPLAVLAMVLCVVPLAHGALTSRASMSTGTPTVRSDKEDYTPGETVTLNTMDYTVIVYPYGTGDPGQTLRHVIRATK